MSFEAWKEGHVAASECLLEVVAPTANLKREAVSPRLRQTLVHSEQSGILAGPVFSADGSLLAASTYNGGKELYLIEVKKGSIRKKINLGEGYFPQECAFSPDSKWIAAISQPLSRDTSLITAKADNLPQPRILLIESATGEVRETLFAPPGIAVSLCFSPDGKTLASGGDGRVLLWDMTKAPGSK